jgi:hypothetical protein
MTSPHLLDGGTQAALHALQQLLPVTNGLGGMVAVEQLAESAERIVTW